MKPCGQSHASRASLLINAASLRPSQRRPSTMRSSSESTSDAARRGPVAPRSRGDCRLERGQRAIHRVHGGDVCAATGTTPRPEAARARASNSDVLQGEASITSSRRHRVARLALNLEVTTIPSPRALATRRILAAACAGDEQRFRRFSAWAAREQDVLRRRRTTSSRRPSPRTRSRRHEIRWPSSRQSN